MNDASLLGFDPAQLPALARHRHRRSRGLEARCRSALRRRRSRPESRSPARRPATGRRSTATSTATTPPSTGSARQTTRTPAACAPTSATASSSAAAPPTTTRSTPTSTATTRRINWNPRQCAKGYTFHRVLYGPYRLRHPIVRKGWKAWADAGFPELTPELKTKYLLRRAAARTSSSRSRGRTRSRTSPARSTPSPGATAARTARSGCSRRAISRRWSRPWAAPAPARSRCAAAWACSASSASTACTGSTTRWPCSTPRSAASSRSEATAGRNWSNYTWHGDQAPGHPWVHGLQASDCDFNDLRFSQAHHHGRQEPGREQADRLALVHRDAWSAAARSWSSRRNTGRRRPRPTTGFPSGRRPTRRCSSASRA